MKNLSLSILLEVREEDVAILLLIVRFTIKMKKEEYDETVALSLNE
jgi:hypothetical protein